MNNMCSLVNQKLKFRFGSVTEKCSYEVPRFAVCYGIPSPEVASWL